MIFILSGAFAYFLVAAFLPVGGRRLEKLIKRINRQKADAGPRAGYQADFSRTVTDAALRAKLAMRYRAGEGVYGVLKRALSKLIIISPERRGTVENKLTRAGYKVKAEEFYADVIIRVVGVYLLVPVFLLLDIKVAAAGTVILGLGLYYKWAGEPDSRLRGITAAISDELPRFISVLGYSMSTDRDLKQTVERYLKIAKPALRYDLELLLLELKAGNNAEALKRFDTRVGIPQLSSFVSGLIDAGRGVDQKTFFYLMEENMKLMFIENRKKELSRRPVKVKKAIIAVGICMFLIYLVPICIQLKDGLEMFR